MRRFLEFLRDEPHLPCDFLSYHRKGVWTEAEGEPRIDRMVAAAETTAAMAQELVPGRRLALVNDEADMKVGFDVPYAPRLDERFPSWLAASAIAHVALSLRHGRRFLAAADNANQHLVRAPFDGRRALFTRTDAGPEDLLKLPVFGFYEMLRLLGDQVLQLEAGPELYRMTTAGEAGIATLLTLQAGAARRLRWAIGEIAWPRVNLVVFRIDGRLSNAFAAAGRGMPGRLDAALARRLRGVAELGMQAPLRSGLVPRDGRLTLGLDLSPHATLLVWLTPFDPVPPEAPKGLRAEAYGDNLLLRWQPGLAPGFFSYELHRRAGAGPWRRIAPLPLRAAEWVDTAPPPGPLEYRLRSLSASGLRGLAVAIRR